MLPAMKECTKLKNLSCDFNLRLKKVETVNLLLKELPDCVEYFSCYGCPSITINLSEVDLSLVKERKSRGLTFDAFILRFEERWNE